jgi:hypothetical protein
LDVSTPQLVGFLLVLSQTTGIDICIRISGLGSSLNGIFVGSNLAAGDYGIRFCSEIETKRIPANGKKVLFSY